MLLGGLGIVDACANAIMPADVAAGDFMPMDKPPNNDASQILNHDNLSPTPWRLANHADSSSSALAHRHYRREMHAERGNALGQHDSTAISWR